MTGTNSGCPLVLIRWEDSRQPTSSWVRLSDLPDTQTPVQCASVGWLIKDTVEVKVICQNMGDIDSEADMQASGIMVIPARCVLSVERLEEVTSDPCHSPSADPGAACSLTPRKEAIALARQIMRNPRTA